VDRHARQPRLGARRARRRGALRSPGLARSARRRRARLPAAVEPQPPERSHRRGRRLRPDDRGAPGAGAR
jgi:hypothetical protein